MGRLRTLLAKVKMADTALLHAQARLDKGWSRTLPEWQSAFIPFIQARKFPTQINQAWPCKSCPKRLAKVKGKFEPGWRG